MATGRCGVSALGRILVLSSATPGPRLTFPKFQIGSNLPGHSSLCCYYSSTSPIFNSQNRFNPIPTCLQITNPPIRIQGISLRRRFSSAVIMSQSTGNASEAPPADAISKAIANNKDWADGQRKKHPEMMAALAKGQKPEILWIGCSDSRVPETSLLGLQPGEVFVHRNIANIVTPGDLSSAAVIEYAVNALQVKHIVLCGHTGCGGVGAALGNKHIGLIDAWLMPLRNMRYRLHDELSKMEADARVPRLVKENVLQGVEVIKENPNVLRALLARKLTVHGFIYNVGTGEIEQLDTNTPKDELEKMRQAFEVA